MDSRINIALVGFGRFGKKYFQCLKKSKRFNLKAIYRKKKLTNKKFSKLTNSDLKKNRIKGAIICTPLDTHFKLSKIFIKNKIPIILEKPAAKNLTEIKKLIELSYKNKSTVLVNHSDLYNKNFKNLIKNVKLIGKIRYIEARFGKFSSNYKDKDYLPAKDWLPHPIALILTIIKKIKKISIISNKINFKKLSIFQKIVLSFEAENKIKGKIYFSNTSRKKNRILLIHGSNGILNYDGYFTKNNFIKTKVKIDSRKNLLSPMENILEIFYKAINGKKFYSDLKMSYEIEKILEKIKKE